MLQYEYMYNWNIDTKLLMKDRKQYAVWRLEQLVNFGLAGEKLKREQLRRYWKELYLDPGKKKYLKLLLWPSRQS